MLADPNSFAPAAVLAAFLPPFVATGVTREAFVTFAVLAGTAFEMALIGAVPEGLADVAAAARRGLVEAAAAGAAGDLRGGICLSVL